MRVSPALFVVLATVFVGCVSKNSHTDDKRTIVVRDAPRDEYSPGLRTYAALHSRAAFRTALASTLTRA